MQQIIISFISGKVQDEWQLCPRACVGFVLPERTVVFYVLMKREKKENEVSAAYLYE